LGRGMPRSAWIDLPGLLQYVIVRGGVPVPRRATDFPVDEGTFGRGDVGKF